MRIFTSWSGDRSKAAALGLKSLLQDLFEEAVQVFVSEHITPGEAWAQRLGTELEQSEFGILCLTRDNWQSPWLLFEAGAIAKNSPRRASSPISSTSCRRPPTAPRSLSSNTSAPIAKAPTASSKASTASATTPSPPTASSAHSPGGGPTSNRPSRPCRLPTPLNPLLAPIASCSRPSCSASKPGRSRASNPMSIYRPSNSLTSATCATTPISTTGVIAVCRRNYATCATSD